MNLPFYPDSDSLSGSELHPDNTSTRLPRTADQRSLKSEATLGMIYSAETWGFFTMHSATKMRIWPWISHRKRPWFQMVRIFFNLNHQGWIKKRCALQLHHRWWAVMGRPQSVQLRFTNSGARILHNSDKMRSSQAEQLQARLFSLPAGLVDW